MTENLRKCMRWNKNILRLSQILQRSHEKTRVYYRNFTVLVSRSGNLRIMPHFINSSVLYCIRVLKLLKSVFGFKLWVIGRAWENCGVRSAECGVRSAECGVRSAECGVRSADTQNAESQNADTQNADSQNAESQYAESQNADTQIADSYKKYWKKNLKDRNQK